MTRHTHDFESVGTIARRVMDGIGATIGCAACHDETPCEPLADDGRGGGMAHQLSGANERSNATTRLEKRGHNFDPFLEQ